MFSDVYGLVSQMPENGLTALRKAEQALDPIASWVLQLRGSDKIPQELMQDSLIAIAQAQRALRTHNAQTIAWSLHTVGQTVMALQAKLKGQDQPQSASAEGPSTDEGGTTAPQQTSTAKAPEQRETRVAAAEPRTAPNTPQAANSSTETKVREERGNATAPSQQAAPEQPMQKSAQAKQPAEQPGQPAQQAQAAQQPGQSAQPAQSAEQSGKQPDKAATQPSPPQNALASMKRDDVIGKWLYDKSGDSIGKVQDVTMSPDGKIKAVEIDVGGFLGIGARRITVPVDSLQLKGDRLESSMTSDQIRNLAQEAK